MKAEIDLTADLIRNKKLARELLGRLTRDFLRELARRLDVKRGRTKADTIENLMAYDVWLPLHARFTVTVERSNHLDNLDRRDR